jgi:HTH-type transcriptional regulator/antitoxin HigA
MNIRPIRNDDDHAAALRRIEAIFEAPVGSPEADELDVLATLVEAYEETRWPIAAPDPVAAIKLRMAQADYTQADLAKVIGSRSRASEVLNKRRGLTLEMVWKLSKKWQIPAESLIKPYKTRQKRGRSAARRGPPFVPKRQTPSRRRGGEPAYTDYCGLSLEIPSA